jgi:hypothetical protein
LLMSVCGILGLGRTHKGQGKNFAVLDDCEVSWFSLNLFSSFS